MGSSKSVSHSLLAVGVAWVLGSCSGPESEAKSYYLEEMRRFGSIDVFDDPANESQDLLGGGLLADVAGIAGTPDPALYGLDRDWRKVVVFGPDTEVDRVIAGGLGDGPDYLSTSQPPAMASSPCSTMSPEGCPGSTARTCTMSSP